MARKLRTEEAGAIHHVFARGNRAEAVFLDDEDRRRYLRLLAAVVADFGWWCLQFCLMTNHLHLLVQTPEPNLGEGMQRLHGDYASGFNRRHKVPGHVFQGRYGAVRIRDDPQLAAVVRYLDRNPVSAGIVATPEAWPWSSARAMRSGRAPSWLAIDRLAALLPAGRIELDAEVALLNPQGGQTPLRVVEVHPSVLSASARRETPSSISSAVTPE